MNKEANEEFYNLKANDYTGEAISMRQFEGKPLIIVNVASKCGLADQTYRDLSLIAEIFFDDGLRVLIFPCNEFLQQEKQEIVEIARAALEINSKFVVFDKVNVMDEGMLKFAVSKSKGQQHELFKYLTNSIDNSWFGKQIKWNFTKFLIDRKGYTIKRYGPTETIKKTDQDLLKALQK